MFRNLLYSTDPLEVNEFIANNKKIKQKDTGAILKQFFTEVVKQWVW